MYITYFKFDSKDVKIGHSVSLVEHMDLLGLTDFNLVVKHGGFGRAARATGRPKATLSRHVAELEVNLGLRLLERGARTLKLTQEGQALYERTGALLTELDEATASIASGGEIPQGRLRISAPLLGVVPRLEHPSAAAAAAYLDLGKVKTDV